MRSGRLLLTLLLLGAAPLYAATVTEQGETWNTTGGNKTVVATPAVGDLIVVIHGIGGWASGDGSVITDDNAGGGGTYTQIGGNPLSNGGGTADALWISIRNNLITSATSTTYTATNTGDTGGGLTVLKVTGMSRVGSSAARQQVGQSTQTENPTVIAFTGASLSGNSLVVAVMGEDNPAGVTAPSGFTETTDTGWSSSLTGIEVAYDSDGNTLSSYSYQAGGALIDHNEVIVELDTSSPPACTSGLNLPLLGVGGCP